MATAAAGTRSSARRLGAHAARIAVNLLGAIVVLLFARATIHSYLQTHRPIGAAFIVVQLWVAAAFLARRCPNAVSRRPLDWVAALGGSFGGFLLRPAGYHPAWGFTAGLIVQVLGLVAWAVSFFALGRSFGLVAADRGLVTRGPYAIVRHPLYTSYMVTQLGYLLQSASPWNGAVLAFTWACQIARALAEERLLVGSGPYERYRARVGWRLVPGIW